MDNIYIYRWKGLISGWDYRLKIYKAGTLYLENINEIYLPPGSISVKKLSREYDKFHWGNQKTPTLELDINLGLLNGYDEFQEMIFNPKLILANPIAPAFTMECGTVFILEIKFNRNSAPDVNIWRPQFYGVLRQDIKIDYDFKLRHKVTLILEDAARIVLDSINPSVINYSDNEENYTYDRDYLHEFAWFKDDYTFGVGHKLDNFKIRFKRRYHFDNFVKQVADAGYKMLLRDETKGLDITITYPLHYKQLYDGSGGLGSYIQDDEIYLAASVYDINKNYGLWGLDNKLSLPNTFKNSIWDYYTELFEQNLSKAIIEPGVFGSIPVYGSLGANEEINLEITKLKRLKINSLLNEVGKITASHYEFYSGSKFSDMGKLEWVKSQGRNTGDIVVPMVYNNTPTAYDDFKLTYNNIFDENWNYGLARWNYQIGKYVKIRNLYYLDSPAILQSGVEGQFFRVHDFVDFFIDTNEKLSDRVGYSFNVYNMFHYYQYPQFHMNEIAMQLQSKGWSAIITKAIGGIFGVNNLVRIEIEIGFNEYTWFEGGGSAGFPHSRMDSRWILDLKNYYRNIDVSSNKWYVVKSELDFETETAKIELLSRGLE